MSFTEQDETSASQTPTPRPPRTRRGGGAATPQIESEARSFQAPREAPALRFRGIGGKRVEIHVDRVRAKPAVSPSLSLNIGATAVGLGLWGLLFPNSVKRLLGVRSSTPVVRTLFGIRELITGVTLTNDPTKAGMLWVRLAGDLFDIAALKALTGRSNPKRRAARAALAVVLIVTALDAITAARMSRVQRNCPR
jgi:hypothetical protein